MGLCTCSLHLTALQTGEFGPRSGEHEPLLSGDRLWLVVDFLSPVPLMAGFDVGLGGFELRIFTGPLLLPTQIVCVGLIWPQRRN